MMKSELSKSLETKLEIIQIILQSKINLIFRWRQNNLRKRQEFNKSNEVEFLENRKRIKDGKQNPWEKVAETVEIKESNYKGTKDISRMRNVIISRKSDIIKMK